MRLIRVHTRKKIIQINKGVPGAGYSFLMCVCSPWQWKVWQYSVWHPSLSSSVSQEDGDGRGRPNYVVVDKKINIKEIIRFSRRSDADGEVSEFDVPKDNAESGSSLTSLLTRVSNAINLRKMKNMLPLSGLELSDTGTAVVCGRQLILRTILYQFFSQYIF